MGLPWMLYALNIYCSISMISSSIIHLCELWRDFVIIISIAVFRSLDAYTLSLLLYALDDDMTLIILSK